VEREKLALPAFEGLDDLQGVRTQVDQRLQTLRLLPAQIRALATKPAEAFSSEALFSKNQILGGLEVSLSQLNIRQVVEIGQALEQISNLIVFKDLVMTPHTQAGYFDVLYQFLVLRPPVSSAQASDSAPSLPRGSGGRPETGRGQARGKSVEGNQNNRQNPRGETNR
jgi:hypothetical protein